MRITCLGIVLVLGLAAGGCSRAVYGTLQNYQRDQCLALDAAHQRACTAAADTSFDEYQRTRTVTR